MRTVALSQGVNAPLFEQTHVPPEAFSGVSLGELRMVSHLETAETLEVARVSIECIGWGKGNYCTPDGRVCAYGAVLAATGDGYDGAAAWSPSTMASLAALDAVSPRKHAASFNDRKSTKKAQVLALFDKAIRNELKAAKAAGEVVR